MTMAEERNLSLVREMLNKEGIKLWLPPYTRENCPDGIYSDDMLGRYASSFNLEKNYMLEVLEKLRKNALQKLGSNKKFKQTGIATLKIKFTKSNALQNIEKHFIETELGIRGSELKSLISSKWAIDSKLFKLICNGRVIDDELSLDSQKLRNNSVLMVLILPVRNAEEDDQLALLKRTREDAALLLGNKEDARLQFTDQHGMAIDIPIAERNAMGIAMALNEKGRSCMKQKNYACALMFLLEADKEFNVCCSDILEMVDNYALVCLDIVWCYLCLRSINDLPDAERRLKVCEDCFHNSYGENFERLVLIKGAIGNEAGLLARLHLLQGIVAFHQNELRQAKLFFDKVSSEICFLRVDPEKLTEVMALGYSEKEARLALRSCGGNVPVAVSFIINKNEERQEIRKREKEARKKKLKSKLLGVTDSGESVNPNLYNSMLEMGFDSKSAKYALSKANNNVTAAIQLIEEHYEQASTSSQANQLTAENIAQLNKLGYDEETAKAALEQSDMDIHKAIDLLVESGGTILHASNSDAIKKEREAAERLAPDITGDEDDHLDISLNEETEFLNEYLQLMKNIKI